MSTITTANSVFMLAITNLYPTPQRLEGYGADDAFTAEAHDLTETVMGIDGNLSGGFIFTPTNIPIILMPDSPAVEIFDTWRTTMRTLRETLTANATIQLPATRKKYTLTKGFLISMPPLPGVKKTLQPITYMTRWQSITVENY
ncbi:phage tail fiber protein [Serratia fonticola]